MQLLPFFLFWWHFSEPGLFSTQADGGDMKCIVFTRRLDLFGSWAFNVCLRRALQLLVSSGFLGRCGTSRLIWSIINRLGWGISILPSFLLRSHQKNGRTRAVCQLLAAILDDEKLPPVTYVVGGNECKVSCLAQFFMANSFCLPQIIPKVQQEISELFDGGFLNFTFTQKDCFWRRATWHCSLIMCWLGQTTRRYASNPDVVLFHLAIFLPWHHCCCTWTLFGCLSIWNSRCCLFFWIHYMMILQEQKFRHRTHHSSAKSNYRQIWMAFTWGGWRIRQSASSQKQALANFARSHREDCLLSKGDWRSMSSLIAAVQRTYGRREQFPLSLPHLSLQKALMFLVVDWFCVPWQHWVNSAVGFSRRELLGVGLPFPSISEALILQCHPCNMYNLEVRVCVLGVAFRRFENQRFEKER